MIYNDLKRVMRLDCWTAGWSEHAGVILVNKCPHPAKFSAVEVVTGVESSVAESRVSGLSRGGADSAQNQPCLQL